MDPKTIMRLLYVKNEADIIDENLQWYAAQGIPAFVVDNGSTDGTYELCERHKGRSILELEVLRTEKFDVEALLRKAKALVDKHRPDWLLIADADEFFETPTGEPLPDLIRRNHAGGYDIIQCDNMEFWMSEQDDPSESSVVKRIRHYSYFPSNMFRVFRNCPGINVWSNMGHSPIFPEGRQGNLAPEHIVSRHYKFRSLEQARRKVRAIRPDGDKHLQYVKYTDDLSWYVLDSSRLTLRNEGEPWNYEAKYFGGRLTKEELQQYLGLGSIAEVEAWLKKRSFRPWSFT